MRSHRGLGFAAAAAMVTGVLAVAGGCRVSADYGGTAYACDESRTCPGGQTCESGQCRTGSVDARPPTDGGGGNPEIDAQVFDAPPETGETCGELLASGETTSGIYMIRPARPPRAPINAYCEMTIAGGGWTLVGRSATGGVGSFGWRVSRGDVTDGDSPYGLDVRDLADFTEVLVTTRSSSGAGSGLDVGDIAYRLPMPAGFPDGFTDDSTSVIIAVTERGSCAPSGGPDAVRFWGFTSETTHYFFNETPLLDLFGLTPAGFVIDSVGCDGGADLEDEDQGMIFVR